MSSETKRPYSSECRDCGRVVRLWLGIKHIKPGEDGRRVRCKECGTSNWCRAEQDPEDIEVDDWE